MGLTLAVRIALFGLLAATAGFAEFAIYNRYFDESGGMFCETRNAEIDLPKSHVCVSSGVDSDVFDLRHSGRANMILIKHRQGLLYECFWFDSHAFAYSTGGWQPALFEHCAKDALDFEMRRKALK